MKQIVCEMCGSNDVAKSEGLFVCQMCGTKYSPDEAKKLMVEIEGPVDVSGSIVKVDSTDKLNNLYDVARRATKSNDHKTAARIYDSIMLEDPTSWEALFFSVYHKAMVCVIKDIESSANSIMNCLDNVISLIRDNVDKKDQSIAVRTVIDYSYDAALNLSNGAWGFYMDVEEKRRVKYRYETACRIDAAAKILIKCGDNIDRLFSQNSYVAGMSEIVWKETIELYERYRVLYGNEWFNSCIRCALSRIVRYDPEYSIEQANKQKTVHVGRITVGSIFSVLGLVVSIGSLSSATALAWWYPILFFFIPFGAIGIFNLLKGVIPSIKSTTKKNKYIQELKDSAKRHSSNS